MGKFNISYNNQTKVEDKDYKILIPDGFHVKKNTEDRAFVAWSGNNPDFEEAFTADITLFDSETLQEHGADIRILSPQVCSSSIHSMFWGHPIQTSCAEAKFIPLAEDYPAGGIYAGYDKHCFYYHIIIYFTKAVKMLRAQIQNVTANDKEECDALITEWVKTLVPTESFESAKTLDDPCFLNAVPSKETVKEFKEAFDVRFTQIVKVFENELTARCEQFKATFHQGKDSIEAVTSDIQTVVNRAAEEMDKFFGAACDALEQIHAKNPGNRFVKEMCGAIKPAIEANDCMKTSIDGGRSMITSPLKNIAFYRNRFSAIN